MSSTFASGTTPQLLANSQQAAAGDKDVQRMHVFAFIKGQGAVGATDDEVRVGLDISPNSAIPRRLELQLRGYIRPTGFERKTRAEKDATVWCAVPEWQREETARKAQIASAQYRLTKGLRMVEDARGKLVAMGVEVQ
jgi:hypothetical protein